MKKSLLFFSLFFFGFSARAELLQNPLGCADSRVFPKEKGAKVYLYPCHGRIRQRFFLKKTPENYFLVLMPPHLCLSNQSGEVVLRSCQGNSEEGWVWENGFLRQGALCLTGDILKKPLALSACENKKGMRWQFLPEIYFWKHKKTQPALKPGEVREEIFFPR